MVFTRRGLLRLLSLALVVAAPVAVLVLYTLASLLGGAVLPSGALWAVAVAAGRAALHPRCQASRDGRVPGARVPDATTETSFPNHHKPDLLGVASGNRH